MPSFDINDRCALVSGASSGLGRHFARTLATAGARVAVAARRMEQLISLQAEIEAAGGRAMPVLLDVSERASVEAGVAKVEQEYGPIEILVNNAGIAVTKPVGQQTETDWDEVMNINVKGAWLLAQEVARRRLEDQCVCSIINIASILGLAGAAQVPAYCASKAALINLTRALTAELARHGIRVNALAPGYIETELNREFLASEAGTRIQRRIPARRFGVPEDLDGALLFLASDASRYVHGSVLTVDGGQTGTI